MANILTATEASNVLRCSATDALMLNLLPAVDAYIRHASGREWTADNPIRDEAKSAARMLLTMWHENPAMVGQGIGSLSHGLAAALMQLEALALELAGSGVPNDALALSGSMPAGGAVDVAIGSDITLIFNHAMAAGATSAVTLTDAAGASVAATNSLDATAKILTVNPNANLTAGARYTVTIDAAPDAYGMTLSEEIVFWTA